MKTTIHAFPRAINLGCGQKPLPDCLNVDFSPRAAFDQRVDLNQYPWPFADGAFDQVHALDVVEHLESSIRCFQEIHRISSHGAIVHITVPHVSCLNAFTDPSHRSHFTFSTFDYFLPGAPFAPETGDFEILSRKLFFRPSLWNKFVWRLANRFPQRYERRWAWIFPAWFMEVKLLVKKRAVSDARG